MNAPLNKIEMLLGALPGDELCQRDRLEQCRTVASHRVHTVESGLARTFLWACCDVVTWNLYAKLPVETLAELAKLCRRLLMLAEQAEKLREVANGLD